MDEVQHLKRDATDGGIAIERRDSARSQGMVFIPGGTFCMGSDRHYPEERPVHRVTVDGFWIDRTPVTNREARKFITGYVSLAEIKPDASQNRKEVHHDTRC